MGDNKVGRSLIQRGLITEKQLEEALKAQLIVGGHLGTCLIELELIDEAALCEALAEIFGVPSAPPDAFTNIDEAAIAAVPAKVADEFRVVPFRIYQKSLHLAMVDPSHLPAVDALSFATDMRIVPWVAPELRIYQALERYYGIPRRLRYITLGKALDSAAGQGKGAPRAPVTPAAARGTARDEEAAARAARLASAVSMNPTADVDRELSFDEEMGFDYGKNWHEVAAELRLDDPDAALDPGGAPAPGALSQATSSVRRSEGTAARAGTSTGEPALVELTDVADRLCRADTKEDIAEAILTYACARMARGILFGVSRHVATPWRAKGLAIARLPQVKLPVASGIFELLLGNELYRGVVPREPKYESSYRILGIERPAEVLLVPLYLGDRLIAVFHGDGGPRGKVTGETEDYVKLFRLFAPTLNLLILKNKIRDSVHPPPEVRKKMQPV